MRVDQKKILPFPVQFIPLFVLFICLYQEIIIAYQEIVFGVCNYFLKHLTPYMQMSTNPHGQRLVNSYDPEHGWRWFVIVNSEDQRVILLNIVFLPALLLAMPIRLRQRLSILLYALITLFAFHTASLLAYVYSLERMYVQKEYDDMFQKVVAIFSAGSQIFVVGVWVLLTWKYWFVESDDHSGRR